MAETFINETVRYEPNENPPNSLLIGAGFQGALVMIGSIVLTVVIVFRIADQPAEYISWGVFAALLISGANTILQAVRFWRFGAGHVLVMGPSGTFIAVCIAALVEAGPALMASLIVVSSLVQFLLAAWLPALRRIFTPVVTGTVIMLIAATVMPIVFDMLTEIPQGSPDMAAPAVLVATLLAILALVFRGPKPLRLWSPVIGTAVGCVVAAPMGLYDFQLVLDAPWFGAPLGSWPGLDFTPGRQFWTLLPAFIAVTIVGAIETIGDGVAIQRVSRRRPAATDYRVVQGALNADGLGNLLSGIAGTLPNTTYSGTIPLVEITGMAARRVGIAIGVILLVLAFLPKATALLIAIPSPVAAAYIGVFFTLLFAQGMRIVVRDGLDHRKAMVVGLSFWVGLGFQNGLIYPDLIGDGFWAVLLGNAMTAGGITAVMLAAALELTSHRGRHLRLALDGEAPQKLYNFLRAFTDRLNCHPAAVNRVTAAAEETLAIMARADARGGRARSRLTVRARQDSGNVELEFASALPCDNVEDRLARLPELPPEPSEDEVSYRLLRHYASEVRHQKYYGFDVVIVSVSSNA
ncbi:MAG: purine/pyrimidine permease [Chloroflexota bacterium]|nr:purine/pyrimidine permease [Chloroflexota bacterium]MDE2682623.1 purine/pyrimidine permease [Chloroflexota bacterium]